MGGHETEFWPLDMSRSDETSPSRALDPSSMILCSLSRDAGMNAGYGRWRTLCQPCPQMAEFPFLHAAFSLQPLPLV